MVRRTGELAFPLAMLTYWLALGHLKAATGASRALLANAETAMTRGKVIEEHLDRLGLAAAANLDQDRRLEIAALHITCSTRSPYFLGASFEAIHFIVSTRSLER